MYWKIRRVIRKIRHIPYSIQQGIENTITWFPIIWKDSQWDYSFLFKIMLKKMELMEEYFDSDYPSSQDHRIYAGDIRKARLALDYISSGKYEAEPYESWHEKREQGIKDDELFEKCCKEEKRLYNENMDIFCNTFKEKVLYWWD